MPIPTPKGDRTVNKKILLGMIACVLLLTVGLLTACDVHSQLPDNQAGTVVALPSLMFNADDLTLDGMSRVDLCAGLAARGAATVVVPTEIEGFIASVVGL